MVLNSKLLFTLKEIIDFETWKMNLEDANEHGFPVWVKAYEARKGYGMPSVLPKDWSNLIKRMAGDDILFDAYHRLVFSRNPTQLKSRFACHGC